MTRYRCGLRKFQINSVRARSLGCLIVLLLVTRAYTQSAGPEFPNPGNPHMTRDNQRKLGLQAAAQVYQQMPVLPDNSPETQYIRQLGQKLVGTIPSERSWPFEFHVVAQKEINAFALPGGPMFVNIGTITAAANEAQLAGVMAHEMSHVYMQHSAKQASKAQTTSMLAGIAGAVLGGTVGSKAGGMVGELGQMGLQMGAQGLMLKYSRTDEAQADAVGAVILYKAGYNPQALADFFKTLETQGGGSPPQWLSDHPNPGNRQEAIEKEIRSWPPETYASDSPAFQKARQHALGVKAYTGEEIAQGAKTGQWSALNKKNGATFSPTGESLVSSATAAGSSPPVHPVSLQSILPSPKMRTADLGAVKIDCPENWQITAPKQRGQFVTIAPPAGIAENDVGYGVLLNGAAPPEGQRMNIDDVTRQLVKELEQNEALQPVGDPQPIAVAGTQGRSVNLHSISPFPGANGQPDKERDRLVTIPRPDGSVIFMVFVAGQTYFDQFEPTFAAMLKSVRF
ncbi:MAG TPA: M48 family metallopeptidase [Candidatus Sulfotelmatobacter sp.]|nr:M48 family metallopeptidase [Candidatus Sulfotelmatobacter sp.]